MEERERGKDREDERKGGRKGEMERGREGPVFYKEIKHYKNMKKKGGATN